MLKDSSGFESVSSSELAMLFSLAFFSFASLFSLCCITPIFDSRSGLVALASTLLLSESSFTRVRTSSMDFSRVKSVTFAPSSSTHWIMLSARATSLSCPFSEIT